MQYKSVHIVPLTILLFTLISAAFNKNKADINPVTYFPVIQNVTLVYESSFGQSVANYFQDGDNIISLSKADDFVYKQNLILKDDGVYTTETNKAKKRQRQQQRQTKWFENKISEMN